MNALTWAPITPYAIDFPGKTFYSGRVMDMLTYQFALVVATRYGGVWIVNKDVPVVEGYETRSLSDGWDDPDCSCLANGPDGETQVYVGCTRTLYYMELATGAAGPQSTLVTTIPFPVDPNTFNRIVVQKARRRIVVATGAGVWWSPIPPNPANVSAYQWQQATGLPGSKVGGLCTRTGDHVHAAMWSTGDAADTAFGIFKGTFQNGALTFARSGVVWTDGGHDYDLVRVSLASCASSPDVAFAVCSKIKREFRGVLKYDAGTDQWREMANNSQLTGNNAPGCQGEFNNCIAVAPDDPALVAFGWQNGTFVQVDDTWTLLQSPMVHNDMHGLLFVKTGPGEHTLYVGGDGGILEVMHPKKTAPTFNDKFNVFLPTLLFRDDGIRTTYGTIDVSRSVDGLIAGGLQDNGVKYLKTPASGYARWMPHDSGDGGTNEFLANGLLVSRESNKSDSFTAARWDAAAGKFGPPIPLPIDVQVSGEKPLMWLCRRVIEPKFTNAKGELMHAVSAALQVNPDLTPLQNVVLGLFAGKGFSNPHWQVIGKPGAHVTAVGSMTGATVFVALETGNVVVVNPATPDAKPQTTLPVPDGTIVQFEVISDTLVFALSAGVTKRSLYVYDGREWKIIPLPVADIVYSFAVDWAHRRLFIVTDTAVYEGVQNPVPDGPHTPGFQTSFSWMDQSTGLPARAHGSHLRIGPDGGQTFLYLSTYGRSVYRTMIDPPGPSWPGMDEAAAVQVLFGVIQDGGGGELNPNTGKVVIVPPRQPVETVLASLFKSERLAGSAKATADRRAALETVRRFVDQEIAAIG